MFFKISFISNLFFFFACSFALKYVNVFIKFSLYSPPCAYINKYKEINRQHTLFLSSVLFNT
jgi:hypothetical protein